MDECLTRASAAFLGCAQGDARHMLALEAVARAIASAEAKPAFLAAHLRAAAAAETAGVARQARGISFHEVYGVLVWGLFSAAC